MMQHFVIIGGSDAGISAALRIKELQKDVRVTLYLKDNYPNYSICGIPFFLSGETKKISDLAHRSLEDLIQQGLMIRMHHQVISIDSEKKQIQVKNLSEDRIFNDEYNKLLIATGAQSNKPDLNGIDLPGVFTIRWIGDMQEVEAFIQNRQPKSALIVGGGYIGMEMADALIRRGLKVTLLERNQQVLKTLDADFSQLVWQELSKNKVEVHFAENLQYISADENQLHIYTTQQKFTADLVLIATGAHPDSILADTVGASIGMHGAIKVNRKMETGVKDIYATGDCVETWYLPLQKYRYIPLGSTAHKQGRVAAENMCGKEKKFKGSLGTQVVKIFEMVVGRTGLNEKECLREKLDYLITTSTIPDHKNYYPGAQELKIKIIGDRKSGLLLGAQLIGKYGSEVSKRLDIFSMALLNQNTVEELLDADLSYTPPLSSPWDAVQMASMQWIRNNGTKS